MTMSEKQPDGDSGIEITKFLKPGPKAVLTKVAYVNDADKIKIDGSGCRMSTGNAYRLLVPSVHTLAAAINSLGSNEAIAIGALKEGVTDGARVVIKRKLPKPERPNVIARTKDFVIFPKYKAGYILFDVDTKGMPQPVHDRVAALGGAWPAIVGAVPKLGGAARVIRKSSSSGISNPTTGETRDSDGEHIFVLVNLATAIPEILKRVHDMLWLAGLGWYVVGAAGQMLERSLIDTAVGSPERLVFEGPVILEDPLVQSPRPAIAFDGRIIDIKNAVLPWGGKDDDAVRAAKQAVRHSLREEREIARAKWSASRIQTLVEKGIRNPTPAPKSANGSTIASLRGSSRSTSSTPRSGPRLSTKLWPIPTNSSGRISTTCSKTPTTPTRVGTARGYGAARTANCVLVRSTEAARTGCWRAGASTGLKILSPTFPLAGTFIHLRTRKFWKGTSGINSQIGPVNTGLVDKNGKPILKDASQVIMERYGVNHMTWAPGEPQIITGKFYEGSGWADDPTAVSYNTFSPTPDSSGGDASLAGPWVDHVKYLYPDQIDHDPYLERFGLRGSERWRQSKPRACAGGRRGHR